MDIAFICYWGRVNDDVFETCVNTFRKHSKAHLQVHSDNRPELKADYGIRWTNVDKSIVKGRRALCKIERLRNVTKNMRNNDRLLVADADLYFLDDPFTAFDKDFDLAITTRCHEWKFNGREYPVNGGVFFFRINDKTRKFVNFYLQQCENPNWPPLVKLRKELGRVYTPDWEIGQDFLLAAWENRDELDLNIVDLGPEYNLCPNTDYFGVRKAQQLIKVAYETKSAKVLHLKSELKLSIYDDWMEDAVIHQGGRKEWLWK